ncbi:Glycerate dehydrogenase [Colletotrichum sidae]|uniref:Glycerate dehydrogenase n=1 Tax=Colletotrichum sidae TaxID=1347389 RepID=A0A4R8TAM4_9PEZI|nr:Glycerate dehydrogenase [Colletotrichum sidae]
MTDAATVIKKPARLPDATHHVVVKLETIHVAVPDIYTGSTTTHEVVGYEYTRPSEAEVAAARVWPASILITTTVPISAATLGEAPYLGMVRITVDVTTKCIITETTGTNHIDLEECRRRGITVMYSPNATMEAVSEHALGMYFSTRRRFIPLHNTMMSHSATRPNPWRATGSMSSLLLDADGRPPHTCANEVVGMIGYGPIGQRIAGMCRALGMRVLVAGRKGVESAGGDAVIVNVGRGGTVDERALLAALEEGRISGAATDVYEVEPAGSGEDSVLLGEAARGLNLVLTPHLAWCADQTRVNIRRVVGDNVRAFVGGEKGGNVVLDMRS